MGTETRCDLVLLSWNHLECTRPCVESLLARTSVPSRLIVVDQGSGTETRAYLDGLASTSTVRVEVLFNRVNVGYPKGMNQGLARATAPYVCFLNNDILVPAGWLEELIAVAEAHPGIGTVCPASNSFDIHPPPGMDWLTLAGQRQARHGRWTEIPYGEGFCLLAKSDLMRRIGGFDETTYEQIYFEDADLGRRVQAEGLRCVMAEGTYVWHHRGKTMATHPDRVRLFEENRRRFVSKWGPEGRQALYALGNGSGEKLRSALESARMEANRGGKVWLVVAASAPDGLLHPHLGIRIQKAHAWLLPWRALWRAAFKRKKFQLIVSDLAWLRWILRTIKPLHHAGVQGIQ